MSTPKFFLETLWMNVDDIPMVLITAHLPAGNQLLGSAQVLLDDNVAELGRLYVDPVFRRHGIGAALVEEAASIAHKEDKVSLTWQVKKDNVEALAFYLAATSAIVTMEDEEDYWLSKPLRDSAEWLEQKIREARPSAELLGGLDLARGRDRAVVAIRPANIPAPSAAAPLSSKGSREEGR